ncbi:hypothetical protein MPNT_20165 [Candidatus Methylacidithermus pantelleriae]|uniref:Uncharacterized protein n=1 Tax=Candidatus Methylacidithermus pantelleriae TaxID=2744239 RepID=A0A8J2BSD7_9BACT|nr:hypothetical protein MPNT_20165 [Candidatus Methylacidithermus pantelleriae]
MNEQNGSQAPGHENDGPKGLKETFYLVEPRIFFRRTVALLIVLDHSTNKLNRTYRHDAYSIHLVPHPLIWCRKRRNPAQNQPVA